jgi:hypothetical protein
MPEAILMITMMRQSLWRLRCGYMVKPVNLRRLMAGRLQRSMCETI